MRTVGFFRELDPERPDVFRESILEAVGTSPGEYEADIVGYLNSGIPLVDIMESTPDVIAGGEYVTAGSSVLTDGVWVWRQDLPYYVQKYHLKLDPDFVRHVVKSEFRIPEEDHGKLLALAETVMREILDMG